MCTFFYIIVEAEERGALTYNRYLAQNFFFYVDRTGSDPFATTSDRIGSGGGDVYQRDAARQSVVVFALDLMPHNNYTAITDTAKNVVESSGAPQEAFHDYNATVPCTFGRALGVLSDLFKDHLPDAAAVARFNTDENDTVDKRQKSEVSLSSHVTELAQSFSDANRPTREVKKAIGGFQAFEASLAARDSDLKMRNSPILNLVFQCFKSAEAAESFSGVNGSMSRSSQQFAELYKTEAVLEFALYAPVRKSAVTHIR